MCYVKKAEVTLHQHDKLEQSRKMINTLTCRHQCLCARAHNSETCKPAAQKMPVHNYRLLVTFVHQVSLHYVKTVEDVFFIRNSEKVIN